MTTGALVGIALNVVASLEALVGVPIIMIERGDDDPKAFWDRAAETICARTGFAFCEGGREQLTRYMSSPSWAGFSSLLRYREPDGTERTVCLLLPPSPGLSTSHAATSLHGGGAYGYKDLPTKDALDAFLTMVWAAECANATGSPAGKARSDAFAAMVIALAEGDPAFVRDPLATPARKFAFMRNRSTTEAALGLAERIMLDVWKGEAEAALRGAGCRATAVPSTAQDVPRVRREGAAPPCQSPQARAAYYGYSGVGDGGDGAAADPGFDMVDNDDVAVTDGNLHIWMYGPPPVPYGPGDPRTYVPRQFSFTWGEQMYEYDNPVVGAPPAPWHPFKGVGDLDQAVSYIWGATGAIAGL